MTDKILGYIPLSLAVTGGVVGIHSSIQSGDINLMDFCRVFWLAWAVLLWSRVMREFVVALKGGNTLIHPLVLEPLILIPLSLFPLEVVETHANELSIAPIWVGVVTAGLIVMGAIRLSELALVRILDPLDPLMGLIFRTSRRVVSHQYAKNIPNICRRCMYCTAHTHLLCAIRPLGPEESNHCSSFVAKNEKDRQVP